MAEDTTSSPSTTGSALPASGASSGPADPKAELERLKGLVRQNQTLIDQKSKESASYQQGINVLQSGIAEADQAVRAYAQGIQAIPDQASLRAFVDQKGQMAAAALGAGTAAVDAIVAQYDADVQNQTKSLADLQAAGAKALSAYQTALGTANEKQAAYNGVKATLSRVQAGVTDITNLQKQIVSASDSGDSASMYFLVGEMRSALKALTIPSPADLQTQLSTALLELEVASKTSRDTQEASDQAQAAVADAQKALDSKRAGRRTALLQAVKNPPTPAQPSTPPSAPQRAPHPVPPAHQPASPSA